MATSPTVPEIISTIPTRLLANVGSARRAAYRQFEPPPKIKISEWAQTNVYLPREVTVRPGWYVAESFQRIILDALLDPRVRRLTFRKSTQVGWTQMLLVIILFFIKVDPRQQMVVLVRDDDAKDKNNTDFKPMIDNSPALQGLVRESKGKERGSKANLTLYPGGKLKWAGASSHSNFRGGQYQNVYFDEVDGYEADLNSQGSPIHQGERRADSFVGEEIILYGSTPAKPKGHSFIDASYEAGNQTTFEMPCPHCNHYQALWWRDPETKVRNFYWERDEDGMPVKASVRYRCAGCGQGIAETKKRWMLDRLRSNIRFPHRFEHPSFHVWAAYSPWGDNWHLLAKEWQDAKGKPELLRAFINLRLGETWDEGAEAVEANALAGRKEHFDGSVGSFDGLGREIDATDRLWDVPNGASLLVCSVDVQGNRLEWQVTAFGPGEEMWVIDYDIIYGLPQDKPGAKGFEDTVTVWDELDHVTMRQYKHQSGLEMRIAITLIDSNYASDSVYEYVLTRQNAARRIFACRGVEKLTKVGLVGESKARKGTVRLFNVSNLVTKDRILDRLRTTAGRPGCMHFPYWLTDDYFDQLTAESKMPRKDRYGRVTYIWQKLRERNEALDLTVYAHAGLWVLQKVLAPAAPQVFGMYTDLSALAAHLKAGTPAVAAPVPGRRMRFSGIS